MVREETLSPITVPVFLDRTQLLLDELRSQSYEELKTLLSCNDQIAHLNYERYQNMDLDRNTSPALLSYSGIQYQYMAPSVFEESYYEYAKEHLRILSGFYGLLRPFDGVVPYRLEMCAKLKVGSFSSLYEFWSSSLYDELTKDDSLILNLASDEYAKTITKYKNTSTTIITCIFGSLIKGKVVEKGVYVKMARGEMVRYLAENNIQDIEGIKSFNRLGYHYSIEKSSQAYLVFLS